MKAGAVPASFAQAMHGLRAQYPFSSLAIACSGGLDSMVLLRLAHAWAAEAGVTLSAFHVHHGLSPHADDWLAHCAASCAALGIAFDFRRITIPKDKSGTEATARRLRYGALGEMCRLHGAGVLLTAHHLDDQAETVLLQLLRGSGPAGLSGMDAANRAPGLLGSDELVMARPLLAQPRAALEACAAELGLAWVEDESNLDPRYARNALRHTVMPALSSAFPGFQQRLARGAAHVASAQRMLDELAAQDLGACLLGEAVDLQRLQALSGDRIHNLLRHLFSVRGLAMPSTAWLAEMVAQLFEAREDAQLKVTHPDCEIRRHRGKLHITPRLPELSGMRDRDDIGVLDREGQGFRWQGEAALAFPAYGGVLHIEPSERGFDPAWLRRQQLTIDFRTGGERLKPAPNRPTRSLKAHYQALGVPAWERERLPVVYREREVLFAAGIGMDCRHFGAEGGELVALRWEASPA
ncbi:tRNA lysidine(34) synthetase TilS [Massilia niastensis]|uniref:tRNA lysidine(34) synthetase TilS n=1 Tax=Massilia niastensis TaxID=544911 RepID=UPI00035D16C9|nr:tRNA lysidine(34) synthetase TilS [Massilia niastensis]